MSPRLPLLCAIAVAAPALAIETGIYTTNITNQMRAATTGAGSIEPIPGSSLQLMKDGEIFYHQAFGAAALNQVHAVDSSTKTVSGAAILSATESSSLPFSLDTRISTLIPQFTGDKAEITIRQAFSHTSGLPGQDTGSPILANPNITLQQATQLIAALPAPNAPAGSIFAYGGLSMHAAGAAAEVATGIPYAQLVQQRIFDPLGMSNSSFYIASQANPRVAGGVRSTASDFAKLMEMLRAGGVNENGTRVLAQASVDQMFTRQPAADVTVANSPLGNADYGIGVWLDRRDPQGNLTGALASGARGFSSWIDFPNGIVGVFATDSSSAQNVVEVLYQLREEVNSAASNPILAGDANRNGAVGIGDFALLAVHYNRTERVWEQGDFTGDGVTDISDFSLLATNFNQSLPSASRQSIPEPSVSALSALAMFVRRPRTRRVAR